MIIDLDSHLRETEFTNRARKLFEERGVEYPRRPGQTEDRTSPNTGRPARPGRSYGYNHSYMYSLEEEWKGGDIARRQVVGADMQKRVEMNALERLDKQVIFPSGVSLPSMTQGPIAADLCRLYNDFARELVSGYEDLLLPCAMMPAGYPEAMVGELRHAVNELGFKAAHLVCWIGEKNLDHEDFAPYFAEAERLGVPLFVHPNGHTGFITERFDNFPAMHALGRPTNCAQALMGLVYGGVFERFPGLKVCFFECSGEFPLYWMHRMDDDFEWLRDDQDRHLDFELSMMPSEYVKRNCYFTIEADEHPLALQMALEEMGDDHLLMATDYPHFDSEYPYTVSKISENSALTGLQKEKILGENARTLLKL
jgi:predicted TIM-barrel fold metal-dependent hydrolase